MRTFRAGEVDENAVVRLDDLVARNRVAALKRAARHGGHTHNGAAAVDRYAVIAAGNVVPIDLAAREPRTPMRAVILEAAQAAVAVAPEHEVPAKRVDAVRPLSPDLHRFRHHVPLAENAARQTLLDLILIVAVHAALRAISKLRYLPLQGEG